MTNDDVLFHRQVLLFPKGEDVGINTACRVLGDPPLPHGGGLSEYEGGPRQFRGWSERKSSKNLH